MTLRHVLPVVFVAVSVALVYAVVRFSRWQAGRADQIDALIHQNTASPCQGMERWDPQKTERAGEQVWQATLRAQRKTRRPLSHEIVPFRRQQR